MDLNQLKYFEVIAKYQNMSRAEEVLHIAQPALSGGLARLEKQLDVKLFDRHKGRLELNEYGKIFLRYVEHINADYEKALKEIGAAKKRMDNTINLAILDMGFSISLIPDFTLRYPDIRIIPQMIYRDPSEDFFLDEYDLIITPLPETFPHVEYIPLLKEELILAVPPTHRFYQREQVTLKDLEGETIYSVGFRSHFYYFIKHLLDEAGVTLAAYNFCIRSDITDMIKKHNAISTILPGVYRLMDKDPELWLLHFNPPIFRETGIAYSTVRKLNSASKKFCNFASSYYENPPETLPF